MLDARRKEDAVVNLLRQRSNPLDQLLPPSKTNVANDIQEWLTTCLHKGDDIKFSNRTSVI